MILENVKWKKKLPMRLYRLHISSYLQYIGICISQLFVTVSKCPTQTTCGDEEVYIAHGCFIGSRAWCWHWFSSQLHHIMMNKIRDICEEASKWLHLEPAAERKNRRGQPCFFYNNAFVRITRESQEKYQGVSGELLHVPKDLRPPLCPASIPPSSATLVTMLPVTIEPGGT